VTDRIDVRTDPALAAARTPFWRDRRLAVVLVVLAIIVGVLGYSMRFHRADDAYVTYLYAKNVLAGNGFVFNQGEHVLGTTAPFHALMLALLGLIFDDLPTLANTLSFLSAYLLAVTILLIALEVGRPRAGVFGAVLVAICTHTYLFAPLETVVVASMSWLLVLFHLRKSWMPFSVLSAVALLTRPDTVLLVALLLAADLLRHRRPGRTLRSGLLVTALVSPWIAFATLSFGSPIPNTAFAKSGWTGQASSFVAEIWPKIFSDLMLGSAAASLLVLAFTLVGGLALLVDRDLRKLWIVPAWMALYLCAYTILKVSYAFSWYYFPLVCGSLFLAGFGLDSALRGLDRRMRDLPATGRRLISTAAILAAAILAAWQIGHGLAVAAEIPTAKWSGARDEIYRSVAGWLTDHAPVGASVAMCEVGAIAYYSEIRVIDLWGLVTPAVIEHAKRGDYEWGVRHFRPDFVVSHYRKKGAKPGPTRWLRESYGDYEIVESFETEAYPFIIDLYRRKALLAPPEIEPEFELRIAD